MGNAPLSNLTIMGRIGCKARVFRAGKENMSQCELLPIVEVCQEAAAIQKAVDNAKWENWGRVGTLTREQMRQMAQPNWQWGDYEI